jgi:hypothetical protein
VTVVLLLASFALIGVGALLFTNAVEWAGERLDLGHGAVGSRNTRLSANSDALLVRDARRGGWCGHRVAFAGDPPAHDDQPHVVQRGEVGERVPAYDNRVGGIPPPKAAELALASHEGRAGRGGRSQRIEVR